MYINIYIYICVIICKYIYIIYICYLYLTFQLDLCMQKMNIYIYIYCIIIYNYILHTYICIYNYIRRIQTHNLLKSKRCHATRLYQARVEANQAPWNMRYYEMKNIWRGKRNLTAVKQCQIWSKKSFVRSQHAMSFTYRGSLLTTPMMEDTKDQ